MNFNSFDFKLTNNLLELSCTADFNLLRLQVAYFWLKCHIYIYYICNSGLTDITQTVFYKKIYIIMRYKVCKMPLFHFT